MRNIDGRWIAVAVAGLISAAACQNIGAVFPPSGLPPEVDGGPTGDAGAPDAGPAYEVQCGAEVAPSMPLFVDRTEAWNLGDGGLDVVGRTMSVADVDGDGYPDLVLQKLVFGKREEIGSSAADGGTGRLVWMLMNRPAPGGGRQFVDATESSGLFQIRGGSATQRRVTQFNVFGDFDNDGDTDAYGAIDVPVSGNEPGDRSEILVNDGAGHFGLADPSAPTPGPNQRLPTTGAAATDADRDGKLDLWVAYHYAPSSYAGFQARLFRGRGDQLFDDATAGAQLTTSSGGFEQGQNHRPAFGTTVCDLNDDGAPELLVAAYGRQQNLLYQNSGSGTFQEVGQDAGYGGDSNVDFTDNQFFRCYCSGNPGAPECVGVPGPGVQCPNPPGANWNAAVDSKPWRNNGNTFGTYCADLNGDGKLDLFNAEIAHWWAGNSSDVSGVLWNQSSAGQLRFARPTRAESGVSWPRVGLDWNEGGVHVNGGDLDLDGREDVLIGATDYPDNRALVYQQTPEGKLQETALPWGVNFPCAAGIAVADFDRDGDLDVVLGSNTARDCSAIWKDQKVRFFENRAAEARRGLGLRLRSVGQGSNRMGIGARVEVTVGGKTQVKEILGGFGHFGSQSEPVLVFGLGACDGADSITVRWPNAARSVETWSKVPAGGLVELQQGSSVPVRVIP